MTGPEHYRKAEQLLQRAEGWPDFNRWSMMPEERAARQAADAACAQVHATLALAASQAPVVNTMDQQAELGHKWNQAVSS